MKKWFILFLLVFFIPLNVDALSYTASDGNSYEVDSVVSFLDYCYFTYPPVDDTYNNYAVVYYSVANQYRCLVRGGYFTTSYNPNVSRNQGALRSNTSSSIGLSATVAISANDYSLVYTNTSNVVNFAPIDGILYSTITTYPADVNGITFNANTSINDILSRYSSAPTPVGPVYQTKNIIFTNFIYDFTLLVPYILVFILIFEGVGWLVNKKD